MTVDYNIENRLCTITVSGRLDTTTAADFRVQISSIDYSELDKVIIDFKNVDYISSAGLRELLIIRKRVSSDDQFELLDPTPDVVDVLRSTGFDTILSIRSSADKLTPADLIRLPIREVLAYKSRQTPNQVYLSGRESYTFSEIEACAQIIAGDLSKMGVGKGTHIAICSSNSVNWILCFFAIQKLGAIAQLINPTLTENEVIGIVESADITHICYGEMPGISNADAFITQILADKACMLEHAYNISESICFKDRASEYEDIDDFSNLNIGFDDPAVMIFSSGTTGRPKGVMLSGFHVLYTAYRNSESACMSASDKICGMLPLYHVFGLCYDFLPSLLVNAILYVPKDMHTNTIISALCDEKCTVFNSVPTMILAIINNPQFDRTRVLHIRNIILGGAATTEAQMRMLMEIFPNTKFGIIYALSEMSHVTMTDYSDTVEHICKTVGRPGTEVEIKIDTEAAKRYGEMTDGVGEVLVRSHNLMIGYYKLPIEVQALDSEGWLHTGDLGYLDEDGYLRLSGRIKELIIRGGENIIPNEIASAISTHPGVADVKVIGVPDDFYGETVGAAIVPKNGQGFDRDEMNEYLKNKIAKYKIPTHYVVYEAFPTLANGKVDVINLKKDFVQRTTK